MAIIQGDRYKIEGLEGGKYSALSIGLRIRVKHLVAVSQP